MQIPRVLTARRLSVIVFCAALLGGRAGALDLSYNITGGAGAALAFGGDLPASLAEFGGSVGADADADGTGAFFAPVLGAAIGFGVEAELAGPLRAVAGMEARRLGYAFWAPEISASSYLALWTAGFRLGFGYELHAWRFGFGASILAPVSSISQATSQGGAGMSIAYDVNAGRALVPGGYLEANLALGSSQTLGTLVATPAVGLSLGLWPTGFIDGVQAWQASVDMIVTLHLEKRTAR